MATFTDDFNRAGPALGSPWATVIGSGLVIDTNQLKSGAAGVNASALTGQTYTDDQTAAITASTIQGYDFGGVAVRMDGSGNGYIAMAEFGDGRFTLYRADAGVLTSLGFRSVTFVATDVMKVGVVGTTFTLYKNDVAQGATFTDATYSSGVAGVAYNFGDSNLTRLDDFVATGANLGPTVTQTDTTPEDGVQQTINTSGLTGPVTAASVGGKSILSLLSGTDPTVAITYTLDIFNGTTTGTSPRFKEPTNLSITATGGAPTQSLTWQPATGDDVITLAGTLNKDPLELLAKVDAALGVTTVVTDQIYYATADSTSITATGVLTSDATSIQMWLLQGGDADNAATSTPFVVTFGPGGSIVIRTKYRRFPWQSHNKLL